VTDLAALSVCSDAEKTTVLAELIAGDPALQRRAEDIAREQLAGVDRAELSATLADALLALDQEDMAHRAGSTRYGYVEPTEAAWQLLEEAFKPWLEDIDRRVLLGLTDAARNLALSILDALRTVAASRDNDLLLISWAPDFADEAAASVHAALRDAGMADRGPPSPMDRPEPP